MNATHRPERLVERLVTYTIEIDGRVLIIEDVPARVNVETGEQLFSPETVERLQAIAWGDRKPDRGAEPPVFRFAP
ncbi:MAG TPA: YgiT-type zinc finger protein [Longimicrobiaceae bacterium]|jgi:YgiT-type zinc finger domain-containing protein|nr:YgiT-type zinc finger protein [Longimicrobiaceae bacterium]